MFCLLNGVNTAAVPVALRNGVCFFDVLWITTVESVVGQVVVLCGVVLHHLLGDWFLLGTEDALLSEGARDRLHQNFRLSDHRVTILL